jgi:3'-5' exoribonuclease
MGIYKNGQGVSDGHITLGLMMLEQFNPGGSQKKYMLLCHMIASHHGRLEFGSPVEPQTKEAVILHTADMLDYQCNVIDKALDGPVTGDWTGKVAGIGREFYVGKVEVEAEDSGDCPF